MVCLRYGLGAEDFDSCGFRVVPADFDLDDDGAFDDLPGRIACKYAGKDKAVDDGFNANSVWVGNPITPAQHSDTARCIHLRMARRLHG